MAARERSPYEPGTNVLVLADALGDAKRDACGDLLAVDAPERLDVLRVTYSRETDELVSAWRRAYGELPARTGIVRVGDQANLTGHDPDLQLVVCFDSLTQMLQFTDVQSAFKFVHMFTGQLRRSTLSPTSTGTPAPTTPRR